MIYGCTVGFRIVPGATLTCNGNQALRMAHSENCRARMPRRDERDSVRQERLGLAEEADREQLRGEVAVGPHPAEGMAVEPAALQPAGSASQRLSESLKRKADPIDHPPGDPWLDLPGGDAETFITT